MTIIHEQVFRHIAIIVDGKRVYADTFMQNGQLESRSYAYFMDIELPSRTKSFTGPSIVDAVASACRYWNCSASEIDYKITKEPGTSGLIKRKAEILATCLL